MGTPPPVTTSLASGLAAVAARAPHRPALVFRQGRGMGRRSRYAHYTYRQLDEAADRIARRLCALGVRRGDRVLLIRNLGIEFYLVFFGLLKAGIVPVMLFRNADPAAVARVVAETHPVAFIGDLEANVQRVVAGLDYPFRVCVQMNWERTSELPSVDDLVEAGGPPIPGDVSADDEGGIFFTSGSTGPSKPVPFHQGYLAAQAAAFREMYGLPAELAETTYGLHVGIGWRIFDLAIGVTVLLTESTMAPPLTTDFAEVTETIEDFGVSLVVSSPSFFDRLGRFARARGHVFDSVRRALTGGDTIAPAAVERLQRALSPDARVVSFYGAQEAHPICMAYGDEIVARAAGMEQGKGAFLGRPLGGVDLEVIRVDDAPIERWSDVLRVRPGEVGELAVATSISAKGYLNRPEATALAKIADKTSGRTFHRLGDLGRRDADGGLWFCGRKSHRIEDERGTFYPACSEAIATCHPLVRRAVTVVVDGRRVLCVEREAADTTSAAEDSIPSIAGRTGCDLALVHPGLPVDPRHNSRIVRDRVVAWVREQRSPDRGEQGGKLG